MGEIKTFVCGLCKRQKKEFRSTREGLRKHLREEHFITSQIANTIIKNDRSKQSWWIVEDFGGKK